MGSLKLVWFNKEGQLGKQGKLTGSPSQGPQVQPVRPGLHPSPIWVFTCEVAKIRGTIQTSKPQCSTGHYQSELMLAVREQTRGHSGMVYMPHALTCSPPLNTGVAGWEYLPQRAVESIAGENEWDRASEEEDSIQIRQIWVIFVFFSFFFRYWLEAKSSWS